MGKKKSMNERPTLNVLELKSRLMQLESICKKLSNIVDSRFDHTLYCATFLIMN